MCMRFDSRRHTYVSGELIARGAAASHCHSCICATCSLACVCVCLCSLACMCVCLCSCARTGDGTGDKRIGHARGIPRSPYPPRAGQKPRPGVCCHWLIRHDTYSSIFTMSLVLLLRDDYNDMCAVHCSALVRLCGTIINSYTYIGTSVSVCVCARLKSTVKKPSQGLRVCVCKIGDRYNKPPDPPCTVTTDRSSRFVIARLQCRRDGIDIYLITLYIIHNIYNNITCTANSHCIIRVYRVQ